MNQETEHEGNANGADQRQAVAIQTHAGERSIHQDAAGSDERTSATGVMSLALPIDSIARAVAERAFAFVAERLGMEQSPWMTKNEAVEYTRLHESTFNKWSASGVIPSVGKRAKLYHRGDVDKALWSL